MLLRLLLGLRRRRSGDASVAPLAIPVLSGLLDLSAHLGRMALESIGLLIEVLAELLGVLLGHVIELPGAGTLEANSICAS
jgi:hypothetical protein